MKNQMTVILTGSTGGLGRNLAYEIQKLEKLSLIAVYRNQEKFRSIFGETGITGYRLHENDSFRDILKLIPEGTSEVTLIINSFSIEPLKPVGNYRSEEIDAMIDANIHQPVVLINLLAAYVKEHGIRLRIINLDSGAADFPLKGWGNYCASKAYINAFLEVFQLENRDFRIVSIDPGVMDTEMQEKIRMVPDDVFDMVSEFRKYKEENVLRSPAFVAGYIVDRYIGAWNSTAFREHIDINTVV
ncbi:MAG: SDR family NAD(P)-dependent oxidoreductase [Lachnospiraceae bacterium]|nr:SDR family NAD(P)-dependent oxidoreductase [Lachnospiraceae bacterium]